MDQTACCQPDVESIMRRLRGQGTPYTPPPATAHVPPPIIHEESQEVEELKQIVRALGAKLKAAYQEAAAKEHELQTALKKSQELADSLHQARAQLETLPQPAPAVDHNEELSSLRTQLASLTANETAWQEEKKTLEATLEKERQQRASEGSNAQLVRLAMSCKQLEGEAHSLRCERAATLRQFSQTKEQLEETARSLASERELKVAAEELASSCKQTIQELKRAAEDHTASIRDLSAEKEAAAQRDASYRSSISELNVAIAKWKANVEALNASLTVTEETRATLHLQLEQEKRIRSEAKEAQTKTLKGKEIAESRVKELEELLITKLKTITELEEQLGEALSNGQDFERRAATAEETVEKLTVDVRQLTEARDALNEKTHSLEQQLGRSLAEATELKKRTELFERLKKSSVEASSHAQAILRIQFYPGTCSKVCIYRLHELGYHLADVRKSDKMR